jgi:hypothetical protein
MLESNSTVHRYKNQKPEARVIREAIGPARIGFRRSGYMSHSKPRTIQTPTKRLRISPVQCGIPTMGARR